MPPNDCPTFGRISGHIYLEEGAVWGITKCLEKNTDIPEKRPLDKSREEVLITKNQQLFKRSEYLELELKYL